MEGTDRWVEVQLDSIVAEELFVLEDTERNVKFSKIFSGIKLCGVSPSWLDRRLNEGKRLASLFGTLFLLNNQNVGHYFC